MLARTLPQIMNVVDLRNGEKIFEHLFASWREALMSARVLEQ